MHQNQHQNQDINSAVSTFCSHQLSQQNDQEEEKIRKKKKESKQMKAEQTVVVMVNKDEMLPPKAIQYTEEVKSPFCSIKNKEVTVSHIDTSHSQWPFDLRYDPASNFTECPVCLFDQSDIKRCVMILPCRHRFCHTCIHQLVNDKKPCPLCRANLDGFRDTKTRIVLVFWGDEIWWVPSPVDIADPGTIRSAVERLLHSLFGAINRLRGTYLSKVANTNQGVDFRDFYSVEQSLGHHLTTQRSNSRVRGLPVMTHESPVLQSMIVDILYFHYPRALRSKDLVDFMLSRWPSLPPSVIQKATSALMEQGYCVWHTKGILRYQL